MDRFVCPVELHVALARYIPKRSERLGSLRFLADVLCFEERQHRESVHYAETCAGFVDVATEREFFWLEPPSGESHLAHPHVTALVVAPASRIHDELPSQRGTEAVQDRSRRFHRPYLVQVADGRS